MAARTIWKAQLKLGTTTIPVALYSAVVDKTVRFHVLEARSETRVKQHMINPETSEEVPSEEIVKGYQAEPGTYVILNRDELAKLQPEASRDIEITRFVSPESISSHWYDRPYYLGPAGDQTAYFAFAEALATQQKEGIARWVMRGKRYVGAVKSENDYLMLVTLRYSGEVVAAEDLPSPAGRDLTKQELAMAKQLVALLEGEYDPAEFKDEYRQRVVKFIESKASGKKPRLSLVKTKRATSELDEALSRSLAALKKKKKEKTAA